MTKKKVKDFDYIPEESAESEGIAEFNKKPTQSDQSKKKLKECQKEKEEYLTQLQQARADLINYRRRQEEALGKLRLYEQANVIKSLLPVLDSLEMGSKGDEGIKRIKEQFESILKQNQVEEIKSVNEAFNPEFHEAVERIESKKQKSGTIVEEVQKGYMLGEMVLRPSRVKVIQ